MDTLPEARDLVEEFRVPGHALGMVAITLLDTMATHKLVELSDATGAPVVRRNVPDTAQLVLAVPDRVRV